MTDKLTGKDRKALLDRFFRKGINVETFKWEPGDFSRKELCYYDYTLEESFAFGTASFRCDADGEGYLVSLWSRPISTGDFLMFSIDKNGEYIKSYLYTDGDSETNLDNGRLDTSLLVALNEHWYAETF